MSALFVFRVLNKGLIMSKNSLRANTLAVSKIEDLKNAAVSAAYNSNWTSVTYTALVTAYATPTTSTVDGVNFYWNVTAKYVTISNGTIGPLPDSIGNTSDLLALNATIKYKDVFGQRSVTRTTYVSNYGR
jgi:hypothetical protein